MMISNQSICNEIHENEKTQKLSLSESGQIETKSSINFNPQQIQLKNFGHLSQQKIKSYEIDFKLFGKSGISRKDRIILRSMICSNSSNKLSKRTVSLACSLVDQYLSKGFKVQQQYFRRFIGRGCLIIGNKFQFNQEIYLGITKEEFPQILECERQILQKLAFMVNPTTPYNIADGIFVLWNQFCAQMNSPNFQENLKFGDISTELKEKCEKLMFAFNLLSQLLDFTFHNVESLKIDSSLLIFNAFYIIFCIQLYEIKLELNLKTIGDLFAKEQITVLLFQKFSQFCISQGFPLKLCLDQNIGVYLGELYLCMISEITEENEKVLNGGFDPNDDQWSDIKTRFIQTNILVKKKESILKFVQSQKVSPKRKSKNRMITRQKFNSASK